MYDPFSLFNYFLKKSLNLNIRLTPVQIELLIYFGHGWYLALNGKPLFTNPIKAWRDGPVVEDIHKFYNKPKLDFQATLDLEKIKELKEVDLPFLDGIWEYYHHLGEIEMIQLCHEPESPWFHTYEKSSRDVVIDNNLIERHYRLIHINHPEFDDHDDPISIY
jgi:uncharacterized phage-associated protein